MPTWLSRQYNNTCHVCFCCHLCTHSPPANCTEKTTSHSCFRIWKNTKLHAIAWLVCFLSASRLPCSIKPEINDTTVYDHVSFSFSSQFNANFWNAEKKENANLVCFVTCLEWINWVSNIRSCIRSWQNTFCMAVINRGCKYGIQETDGCVLDEKKIILSTLCSKHPCCFNLSHFHVLIFGKKQTAETAYSSSLGMETADKLSDILAWS